MDYGYGYGYALVREGRITHLVRTAHDDVPCGFTAKAVALCRPHEVGDVIDYGKPSQWGFLRERP